MLLKKEAVTTLATDAPPPAPPEHGPDWQPSPQYSLVVPQ
jgi:hypothetical protein